MANINQESINKIWSKIWKEERNNLPKDIFLKELFLEGFDMIWERALAREFLKNNFFSHRLFLEGYPLFKKYILERKPKNILEIGAGSGRYGLKIANDFRNIHVTITDILQESLDFIKILLEKTKLENVDLEKEDANNLSFSDNSFDMIICDAVISYLPDPEKALKEMVRVLRPGGWVVVSAVNFWNLPHTFYKLAKGKKYLYGYEKSFTKKKLLKLFKSCGINIVYHDGFYPAYSIYRFKNLHYMFNFLGRALNRLTKLLDKYTNRFFSKNFGFEIAVVGEKPESDVKKIEKKIKKIIELTKKPIPTEKELQMVEIIVLKYKAPEVEVECAKNIIENTKWPFKLTLYDNRLGTKNTSKIWNKLIKESNCDYVLIMDSDVFVPKLNPCWLTRMMSTFVKKDCFVVVPRITKTSCSQQRYNKAEDKEPEKLTEVFAAQCVLYKKEIFDKVGYFDEDFLFYGQDTEWSYRLIKLGYNPYIRHDVLVKHIGHYSAKKESLSKPEFDMILEREYADELVKEKVKKHKGKSRNKT